MVDVNLEYMRQLKKFVVVPALARVGLAGRNRVQLVIGTGLTESHLTYIDQIDKYNRPGPAYGLFQMERFTHDDIWNNYLAYHPKRAAQLKTLMIPGLTPVDQLHGNDYYAAAMCGIFYLRFREALPVVGDLGAMAKYWKKYYNTHLGKGKVSDFERKAAPVLKL